MFVFISNPVLTDFNFASKAPTAGTKRKKCTYTCATTLYICWTPLNGHHMALNAYTKKKKFKLMKTHNYYPHKCKYTGKG